MNLLKSREKINKIDAKIVDLLSQRQSVVAIIGAYKKKHGLPTYQPAREKEILTNLKKISKEKKVSPEFVEKIFKLIFKQSKALQRKI